MNTQLIWPSTQSEAPTLLHIGKKAAKDYPRALGRNVRQ